MISLFTATIAPGLRTQANAAAITTPSHPKAGSNHSALVARKTMVIEIKVARARLVTLAADMYECLYDACREVYGGLWDVSWQVNEVCFREE